MATQTADLVNRILRVADRRDEILDDPWKFARFVRTRDYEETGSLRPYPTPDELPFVADLHNFYRISPVGEKSRRVLCKSRRMLATTAWCYERLWDFTRSHFHKGSQIFLDDSGILQACAISISEPHAKRLIRRIREMIDTLPEYIRPELEVDNALELKFKHTGSIFGLHSGGDAPRQEGYTCALMDELAFQDNADANWQALLAATRDVCAVSTPNGTGNLFHELWSGKIGGVEKLELGYEMHPHRRPGTQQGDKWITQTRAGMPEADWLREYERRFDVYSEPGWFTLDWQQGSQINNLQWDGRATIVRGWDFGGRRPACVWTYINRNWQLCVLRELLGIDEDIESFAQRVLDTSAALWPGAIFRDAGDPAAAQYGPIKTATGENTQFDVLRRMGIDLQFDEIRRISRADGHRLIRMHLKTRPDGRVGMLIEPTQCPLLVEGFKGAYRQPKLREGREWSKILEREDPNPADNTYRHLFDALRYLVVQFADYPVEQIAPVQVVNMNLIMAAKQRNMQDRIARGLL